MQSFVTWFKKNIHPEYPATKGEYMHIVNQRLLNSIGPYIDEVVVPSIIFFNKEECVCQRKK